MWLKDVKIHDQKVQTASSVGCISWQWQPLHLRVAISGCFRLKLKQSSRRTCSKCKKVKMLNSYRLRTKTRDIGFLICSNPGWQILGFKACNHLGTSGGIFW